MNQSTNPGRVGAAQLVLYGFVSESEDVYSWAIPLLHETLLAGRDREHRVKRLLEELPADPASWTELPASAGQ